MKFMISSKERPNNHPINVVNIDLEPFILYNDMSLVDDDSPIVEISKVLEVISSVHNDLIAEKVKQDVDCLQPGSSSEKAIETMQERIIVETMSHPPTSKINQPSKFQFLDE